MEKTFQMFGHGTPEDENIWELAKELKSLLGDIG